MQISSFYFHFKLKLFSLHSFYFYFTLNKLKLFFKWITTIHLTVNLIVNVKLYLITNEYIKSLIILIIIDFNVKFKLKRLITN